MSNSESSKLPLWVQDRETVIASEPDVEWREGHHPDYSQTNKFLKEGSLYHHPEGSLEAITQNLVRTFEMEASYKSNPQQWLSIVADKFRMQTNGGPTYMAQDIAERGTYNLFLGDTEHYRSSDESLDSSVEVFHQAFPDGFLWEVVEVLSGPPNVTFKWRHWGTFSGAFKDRASTGETIEVIGVSVARVTEDLKVVTLEHYFDNSQFLKKLSSGCPFHG